MPRSIHVLMIACHILCIFAGGPSPTAHGMVRRLHLLEAPVAVSQPRLGTCVNLAGQHEEAGPFARQGQGKLQLHRGTCALPAPPQFATVGSVVPGTACRVHTSVAALCSWALCKQKLYEQKHYRKAVKLADNILKRHPNHGGTPNLAAVAAGVVSCAVLMIPSPRCRDPGDEGVGHERNGQAGGSHGAGEARHP